MYKKKEVNSHTIWLANSYRELIRSDNNPLLIGYDHPLNMQHTVYFKANNGLGSRFDEHFSIRDFFIDQKTDYAFGLTQVLY